MCNSNVIAKYILFQHTNTTSKIVESSAMIAFKRVNTELLSFKSKSYKSHAHDYNIAADRIVQLEVENEDNEKTIKALENIVAKNNEMEIEIKNKNAEIESLHRR